MTPQDLTLVADDAASIEPEHFSTIFYDTLFDFAPEARALFPADLSDQRAKLMIEIATMVSFATSAVSGDLDRFAGRARRLGARHVSYGATAAHYDVVGAALIATLSGTVAGWDDDHEAAWTRLYALIAATMLDGARDIQPAG